MTQTATSNEFKNHTNQSSNWKGSNIAVMVGGFILFAPLGFAALAWMIVGKNVDIIHSIKNLGSNMKSKGCSHKRRHGFKSSTGNSAFDTYKEDSIQKLEEEMRAKREQLRAEETQFREFVINLQQAKDQAEFNQFMKTQESKAASNAEETKEN